MDNYFDLVDSYCGAESELGHAVVQVLHALVSFELLSNLGLASSPVAGHLKEGSA